MLLLASCVPNAPHRGSVQATSKEILSKMEEPRHFGFPFLRAISIMLNAQESRNLIGKKPFKVLEYFKADLKFWLVCKSNDSADDAQGCLSC